MPIPTALLAMPLNMKWVCRFKINFNYSFEELLLGLLSIIINLKHRVKAPIHWNDLRTLCPHTQVSVVFRSIQLHYCDVFQCGWYICTKTSQSRKQYLKYLVLIPLIYFGSFLCSVIRIYINLNTLIPQFFKYSMFYWLKKLSI